MLGFASACVWIYVMDLCRDMVRSDLAADSVFVTGATFYPGTGSVSDLALHLQGDRIVGWRDPADLPVADLPVSAHPLAPPARTSPACHGGSRVLDLTGWRVAPGLIDLQLNGCGGVMFNDAIAPDTLDTMHQANLRSGTTSFLPTLITAPDADMAAAIAVTAAAVQQHPDRILGVHLEGPYLNPKRKGIHDGHQIRASDPKMVAQLIAAGPDVVRLVTLAPECVPAATIRQLREAGIVVSAGHSAATYEEAMAGFAAGVTMVTHLFNAMTPWLGRQPGLVAAALRSPQVYAGIIADGYHVHFGSIALAHQVKQDHLILVTDATPPAGAPPDSAARHSFRIGGQEVFYRDGQCLSVEGTLGGSALTGMAAIANCVQQADIPLEEALRMMTLYPAQAIGVGDRLGRLAAGYGANLVIFDDAFRVGGAIAAGQLHWFADSEALT